MHEYFVKWKALEDCGILELQYGNREVLCTDPNGLAAIAAIESQGIVLNIC